MKATIRAYKGNADVFYGEIANLSISWDGMTWESGEEWGEWAKEVLEPIEDAENYSDIVKTLYMFTDNLILD